ncbi:MAG: hypothetical protein WD490_10925 [Opitutales bacterium]
MISFQQTTPGAHRFLTSMSLDMPGAFRRVGLLSASGSPGHSQVHIVKAGGRGKKRRFFVARREAWGRNSRPQPILFLAVKAVFPLYCGQP